MGLLKVSKIAVWAGALPVIRGLRPGFRKLVQWRKRVVSMRHRRELGRRWQRRHSSPAGSIVRTPLQQLAVTVISLPARTDRLKEFEVEMDRVGITDYTVTPGVPGKDLFPKLPVDFSGAIGCNLAHAEALDRHDWGAKSLLMVCEDDLELLVDRPRLIRLIEEFAQNSDLDVLCLAGRVRGPRLPVSDSLWVATGIVGQACYILKPRIASRLSSIWRKGVDDLQKQDLSGKNDVVWNRVQRREAFFAFPRVQVARQRAGYSDIQGRELPVQESTG